MKKRSLGKDTGRNGHYIINMGSQRWKTGGNWLLADPYLQCSLPGSNVMLCYFLIQVIPRLGSFRKQNFQNVFTPYIDNMDENVTKCYFYILSFPD